MLILEAAQICFSTEVID